ncbi:MFS transporter [Kineococcus sp. NBC_00420]|uniref:MFS transporter n=1 Tax=Kineococcus sp. NBC_00420 TaxID=2903564 RepID=UPI002E1FDBA8
MFSRPVSFVVAGAAGAATLTAASAPSPLYPVYQRLWGLSAFTLTTVFAVYVFALLVSLLTVGSLSDRVGRRPVASTALVLLAVGTFLFTVADGPGGLVAARIVQGLAVGAATGTTTALVMDSAPGPRTGSIVSSAVPTFGIALGAALAGALVEFAPHPRELVFWVLAVVYLLLAALVWWVPERARTTTSPEPLWRSLLPSAGVPATTRPVFFGLLPSIAATWALGGLYLSLGSSVIGSVLGVHDHFVVGLVLAVFFTAGTCGTALSALLPPRARQGFGLGTLALGVLTTIEAMSSSSLPLYVTGSVIAGLGFGATFRFAVDALGKAAPPAQRGQVFATMYIVSYLAFSVPALAAGLAVARFGLEPTVVAYGVFDVALVAVAGVTAFVRTRRTTTEEAAERQASNRP